MNWRDVLPVHPASELFPLLSESELRELATEQLLAKFTEPEPISDGNCDTNQDFWQHSLGKLAGEAISLEAYWKRQFGDWEKFEVTSDLVTLAEQAAEAWNKLVAKLKAAA